jgi:hypothetical protein
MIPPPPGLSISAVTTPPLVSVPPRPSPIPVAVHRPRRRYPVRLTELHPEQKQSEHRRKGCSRSRVSEMSRKYSQTTWGNYEMHQFRTCMMQHGLAE